MAEPSEVDGMRRFRDFFLVLAMFGFVAFAAAALSGVVDRGFESLGGMLGWLIR